MGRYKIIDVEQGSDEWIQTRLGKMTGSKAYLLLVNGRDELGIGKDMYSFIYEKVGEIVTGQSCDQFKGNYATDRGNSMEPLAREAYEEETFSLVDQVGFCQLSDYAGFSPDGLVGSKGLVEFKCPLPPAFARYLDGKEIDKKHIAQMQFGMFVTGLPWCDYVVYHPEFGKQSLQITRIEADESKFEKFEQKLKVFQSEIERLLADYN